MCWFSSSAELSCKQTRTWHLDGLSVILTYFIATVFYYCLLYFLSMRDNPELYNKQFCEFFEWSHFWVALPAKERMKFHSSLGKK